MPALAIILARAGSKGLPGKNAVALCGRPMIQHTIDHAHAARRLDRVTVSTDGAAIANAARQLGVHVIQRPGHLAGDTATVDAAARHAVLSVQSETGCEFDTVVILYGNVPVRPAGLIDRAVDKLVDTGCDSVQSVCPVGKHHPFWMKTLGGQRGEDELRMYQDNRVYRRQDLPPAYMLDGGVIAVTRDALFTTRRREPHAFLGNDRRAVVTQPGEVIDVDDDIDLALAEVMLNRAGRNVAPTSIAG